MRGLFFLCVTILLQSILWLVPVLYESLALFYGNVLWVLNLSLNCGTMEDEEIFSRRENNEGISLTGGPGDPASPASLVHKADRWEGRGGRGVLGGLG